MRVEVGFEERNPNVGGEGGEVATEGGLGGAEDEELKEENDESVKLV